MYLRRTTLAVGLVAGFLFSHETFAQYAPAGVQTNIPEATVTGGGWTTCHSSNFNSAGTPLATIQADCDKANVMLACRPVGSPNFSLLAQAPRADVFFDTGDSNTPHDANGVGWYYSDDWSWGFAPQGETLFRDTCDYDGDGPQTVPELRMCIHTDAGLTEPGYRCGDDAIDYTSGTWERVILESDSGVAAGVYIGNAGPNEPVVVAEELGVPPTRTIANLGGALDIITNVEYAFSPGEVRYARLACGIEFVPGTTVSLSGDPSNTVGAINGVGTYAIFFSITAGANPVRADNQLTIGGDRGIANSIVPAGGVGCDYSLYDHPSQAQAGGDEGRVASAGGAYLLFRPSYALVVDSMGLATADVESDAPPYSEFTLPSPTGDPAVGQLGSITFGTVDDVLGETQPIGLDGLPVELIDLLDAETALVFEGDFSAAAGVFFSFGSDCGPPNGPVDAFDDTSAVITIGPEGGTAYLCFAAGGDPIPVSGYTVALDAVAEDPATHATPDVMAQPMGEIVRNGTQLQAPLAQVPGGWESHIILTNTGAGDRPYELSLMGESGNVIGVDSTLLVGLVPGNGTKVIDLNEILLTFTGKRRATVNVTVAAPNSQIQGQYQIISPNGALSNVIMVRPGTN